MGLDSSRASSAGGSRPGTTSSQRNKGSQWSQWREQAQEILISIKFDIAIGVVIFLNAVSIGVEQALELGGHDLTAVKVLEHVFLTIYVFELLSRVFAYGLKVFRDNWVRFDAIMVVLGVITSWIIEPAMSGSEPNALGPVLILRTARLLRLAKAGRLFARVEEFWMLIRSFLCSFPLMCYTFVILFIIMYIFAALGVELVTKSSLNRGPDSDPEFQETVRLYFDGLPLTMLTLVNFVCLDNMSDVWQPLISKDWTLSMYFMTVVLVMGIIIMNIITSVIIASTEAQNSLDKDINKQEQDVKMHTVIKDLKKMFLRIDVDTSGFLTRDEVLNISKADQEFLSRALKVGTPVQVFNALDVEGTGKVTINDFFEGLWDVTAKAKDLKLQRMEKQVEMMHWRVKETFDAQYLMSRSVDRLVDEIAALTVKVESARSPASAGRQDKMISSRRGSVLAGTVFAGLPVHSLLEEDGEQLGGRRQSDGQKKAAPPRRQSSTSQRPESAWAETLSSRLQGILAESMQRSLEEVQAVAADMGRTSPGFSRQTSPESEGPPSPARLAAGAGRRDSASGAAKAPAPAAGSRRASGGGAAGSQKAGGATPQRGVAGALGGSPPAASNNSQHAASDKNGDRTAASGTGTSGSDRAASSPAGSVKEDKVLLPMAGSSDGGRRDQVGERHAKQPASTPAQARGPPLEVAQGVPGSREQALPSRIVTM